MQVFDILLSEEGDLLIQHGDFVIGESTAQHMALLLQSDKGYIRHAPTMGENVVDLLFDDGAGVAAFRAGVEDTFKRDGMKITSFKTDGLKPIISAEYV